MFCWRRPSDTAIRAFVSAQAAQPFSYSEIGATRGAVPADYTAHHHRVRLGAGEAVFARAVAALRGWKMFGIGGVTLCWPDAPQQVGTTVAVLAGAAGVWSLNACRIVYLLDEPGPPVRVGFAYGTLPEHVVRGEERFAIEWSISGDVHYDLFAVSRPRSPLLAVARPLLRAAQRRFARGSLAAMQRAVAA